MRQRAASVQVKGLETIKLSTFLFLASLVFINYL
jgi:hypothetical protein